MSLPDIDFSKIRRHGNQANAFEELCCLLASNEASLDRVRFDRKGSGGCRCRDVTAIDHGTDSRRG